MFPGLRHHAVIGRDDQQREIDARGARQHRLNETLMTRNVDEPENVTVRPLLGRAFGNRNIGEAEIDADSTGLLLLETIRPDAGESLHEQGLAMVDMSGRSDDHRVLVLGLSEWKAGTVASPSWRLRDPDGGKEWESNPPETSDASQRF